MGARTYWVAPVPPLQASDGTAVTAASLTDATSNVATVGVTLFPGMLEVGTHIRMWATGELTEGTTANTLTIGFYYGGVAGTAIASGAGLAVATGGTAETSWPWRMQWDGVVRTDGTSGSLKGEGIFFGPALVTGLSSAMLPYPIPQTAAARTVTVDTTATKVITVGAAWSATTGAPSLTCYDLVVELIG